MRRAIITSVLLACGGTDNNPLPMTSPDSGVTQMNGQDASAPTDDGASDAPVEAGPYGAPSTTYPAYTPWMGQLSKLGGLVLSKPIVVTITWDGDTGRDTFEAFGDGIGASSYWSAAVGEYGVGAVTSGAMNHAHVTSAPPMQMNDQAIRQFIQSNLGGVLPAWTSQTIYVVYLSKSTTLVFNGQNACQAGVGGYHENFNNNGQQVIYAVLPRCGSDNGVTSASSHEIGEAAIDPLPNGNPGIRSFDDEFFAFETWQRNNDENGDACEFFKDSYYTESMPFAFSVQRLWSNKQGPLGHSPCQPYTDTYWNMAPLEMTDIHVTLGQQTIKAKGYKAKQGDTIQVPIGFYSDGATMPWTVSAAESNPIVMPVMGRLSVSIDPMKTSGVNGEKTFVNVKVMMEGPQKIELFTVISQLGNTKHYLPLLVSNE